MINYEENIRSMLKWLINLFKRKVYVVYNVKGVEIKDTVDKDFFYRKDGYKAILKTKRNHSDLKVSVYKNTQVLANRLDDVVTYTKTGAEITYTPDKSVKRIIIVSETKDNNPKINLSLTPRNHVFPADGGEIVFLAKAESYNSKDNPELFSFSAEGPAMTHNWTLKNDTLIAIMAPTKEHADYELKAKVKVSYKGYEMMASVTQEYK